MHNADSYDEHVVGFEINRGKTSKYDAILKNKITGQFKRTPFGMKRFQQFEDNLRHYSHLDNTDEKRRKNWLSRHRQNIDYKFTSTWFARHYLWITMLLFLNKTIIWGIPYDGCNSTSTSIECNPLV